MPAKYQALEFQDVLPGLMIPQPKSSDDFNQYLIRLDDDSRNKIALRLLAMSMLARTKVGKERFHELIQLCMRTFSRKRKLAVWAHVRVLIRQRNDISFEDLPLGAWLLDLCYIMRAALPSSAEIFQFTNTLTKSYTTSTPAGSVSLMPLRNVTHFPANCSRKHVISALVCFNRGPHQAAQQHIDPLLHAHLSNGGSAVTMMSQLLALTRHVDTDMRLSACFYLTSSLPLVSLANQSKAYGEMIRMLFDNDAGVFNTVFDMLTPKGQKTQESVTKILRLSGSYILRIKATSEPLSNELNQLSQELKDVKKPHTHNTAQVNPEQLSYLLRQLGKLNADIPHIQHIHQQISESHASHSDVLRELRCLVIKIIITVNHLYTIQETLADIDPSPKCIQMLSRIIRRIAHTDNSNLVDELVAIIVNANTETIRNCIQDIILTFEYLTAVQRITLAIALFPDELDIDDIYMMADQVAWAGGRVSKKSLSLFILTLFDALTSEDKPLDNMYGFENMYHILSTGLRYLSDEQIFAIIDGSAKIARSPSHAQFRECIYMNLAGETDSLSIEAKTKIIISLIDASIYYIDHDGGFNGFNEGPLSDVAYNAIEPEPGEFESPYMFTALIDYLNSSSVLDTDVSSYYGFSHDVINYSIYAVLNSIPKSTNANLTTYVSTFIRLMNQHKLLTRYPGAVLKILHRLIPYSSDSDRTIIFATLDSQQSNGDKSARERYSRPLVANARPPKPASSLSQLSDAKAGHQLTLIGTLKSELPTASPEEKLATLVAFSKRLDDDARLDVSSVICHSLAVDCTPRELPLQVFKTIATQYANTEKPLPNGAMNCLLMLAWAPKTSIDLNAEMAKITNPFLQAAAPVLSFMIGLIVSFGSSTIGELSSEKDAIGPNPKARRTF